MFGWTLLWVFLFLCWTGAVFRMGYEAGKTHSFASFLAGLSKPWKRDDPPAGTRV